MEWEGHGLCRGSPGESLRVLVFRRSSSFGCRLAPVEVAWANPHLGDLVALVARQMFKGIAPVDGFGATISCRGRERSFGNSRQCWVQISSRFRPKDGR